jgi:ATP-binding cassette, subfamily B, bacterial
MNDNDISSRQDFQSFIRDNGLFSFRCNKKLKEDRKNNKSLFAIILRLLKEFKRQRAQLILVIGMGFMVNLLAAAFPWAGKYMIDNILPQKSFMLLVAGCVVLTLIGVIDVCLNYFRDYKTTTISGNFSISIKNRMMRHLQRLSLVRIQELKVGGIISRLQQDTDAMSSLLFTAIVTPFNAIVMLVIALSSLFLISWKVSLFCIAFSFCIGAIGYFVFNIMLPFQKKLREDNSTISELLTEAFNGATVVRSFCKEKTINREYGYRIGLLWRKTLYGNIIDMSVSRSIWFIYYLMQSSIWLLGGYSVINGNMTVGEIVVFISFIPFIFNPIFNIMASLSQLQQSLACAERAFDLLDEKPYVACTKNNTVLRKLERGIEFDNVSFEYPNGKLALKNISITIPKGKVTALVGSSGGGKTTLTNLILRFYAVTEGKIKIDGIDIKELDLNNYRKMLSLVLQEVFLFDSTIRDNICFGNRKAQQNEVEKVARIAHCHEFIQDLEKKYDTLVGEKGVKLSGGQKQRIALARALLTDPQLLILDEATSSLDSESENLIQIALKEIFKHRTTIVIAHRLSTILDADNIIVIEHGKVIEQGTHEELLKKRGRFAAMYNKQMEKIKITQNYWDS